MLNCLLSLPLFSNAWRKATQFWPETLCSLKKYHPYLRTCHDSNSLIIKRCKYASAHFIASKITLANNSKDRTQVFSLNDKRVFFGCVAGWITLRTGSAKVNVHRSSWLHPNSVLIFMWWRALQVSDDKPDSNRLLPICKENTTSTHHDRCFLLSQ